MRAITAVVLVPSTSAGSSRWRSAERQAPASSCSPPSISMKPVTRCTSYSTAMRPDTGVHPSPTEKSMMRISPHHNAGIE